MAKRRESKASPPSKSSRAPQVSAGWLTFPKVDRCEWFPVTIARDKINPAQAELIDRLVAILRESKG